MKSDTNHYYGEWRGTRVHISMWNDGDIWNKDLRTEEEKESYKKRNSLLPFFLNILIITHP